MNQLEIPYPWQENEWQSLNARAVQHQLPHAILLTGVQGLGKCRFAQAFAQFLLCRSSERSKKACGHCKSCLLFSGQTHPDFVLIEEPDGAKIKMDAILELIEWLQQSSHQGSYKIAIISPAQAMNKSAANALLKTLEEPSSNTLLILISDQPSLLPATIISRCQMIKFSNHGYEYDKIKLIQQEISQDEAELLLQLTEGAPLEAIRFAQSDKLRERQQLLEDLIALQQDEQDPIALATEYSQWELSDLLKWLTDCVVDCIRVGSALPDKYLLNQDMTPKITMIASQMKLKTLYQLLDRLLQLKRQQALGFNLNRQLLVESVFCQWRGLRVKNR